MKVLAGDVGGTHARLAVVEITATSWKMLAERRYESRKFDGLAPIVEEFRTNVAGDVEAASFGVAGSIENGRVQLTKLDWSIDVQGF
ncbi:MAG TPA: glucokinase, partial [Gemmatimonadales bacterium]|nr:glucokinase [Gemmatimonadales bacterium]